MNIKIIGSTNINHIATKEEFDTAGGHFAGICYMKNDFDSILSEPQEKTERRVNLTKTGGHHSVYDHEFVNLYLEDIPKGLAMVLNNENMYTTSEKSARYTKMVLSENEQKLYDKWSNIYEQQIREVYAAKYPKYFTDLKIKKLAQENARYLTSVLTPTSMAYTVSYRQLNQLYAMIKREISDPALKDTRCNLSKILEPSMKEFCTYLENNIPYIDAELSKNPKDRKLSINGSPDMDENFGSVYSTSYEATYAYFAQVQRHRTIDYSIFDLSEPKFYIPPIIKNNKELTAEWEADCKSLESIVPQGTIIGINERGTIENFILKLKERKCSATQLETDKTTTLQLYHYITELKNKKYFNQSKLDGSIAVIKYYQLMDNSIHKKDISLTTDYEKEKTAKIVETTQKQIDLLEPFTKGSRCTAGYKCPTPCGFPDGINGTRII